MLDGAVPALHEPDAEVRDQREIDLQQQQRPVSAAYDSLRAWTDTAFGGALRGDFQPIQRTNNGDALIAKLDFAASAKHTLSLK